jgi:hypothetical protein
VRRGRRCSVLLGFEGKGVWYCYTVYECGLGRDGMGWESRSDGVCCGIWVAFIVVLYFYCTEVTYILLF